MENEKENKTVHMENEKENKKAHMENEMGNKIRPHGKRKAPLEPSLAAILEATWIQTALICVNVVQFVDRQILYPHFVTTPKNFVPPFCNDTQKFCTPIL